MRQKKIPKSFKLVIHGGLESTHLSLKLQIKYHTALRQALYIGYQELLEGNSSIDAVQKAVETLENEKIFNAGHGAALTQLGTIELDAAIMDGKSLSAGSVSGISRIANPIKIARKILDYSEHVMLIGRSAEIFAKTHGIQWVDPEILITEEQRKKLIAFQKKRYKKLSQHPYGTVGAVALDQYGNLAAATSTGGLINKTPGRVGDSCIIGAGTYADNNSCAVSTTGQGEYFMRLLTSYDIVALMRYKEFSLKKSVDFCLKKIMRLGGSGGIIALDNNGNIAISFNTQGMYRGYIDYQGIITKIY